MPRRQNLKARQKILSAAHALLYKWGYKGVSMDDIAGAAGMKKANLFHYYPSKEDLALAVFDRAAEELREKVRALWSDDKSDPVELVRRMFRDAAADMRENRCRGGCFIGNLAQEMSDTHEELRRRIDDCLQEWTLALSRYFARQKSAGRFHGDFRPDAAAQAVLALFEGALILSKASRQVTPLESAEIMAVHCLESLQRK